MSLWAVALRHDAMDSSVYPPRDIMHAWSSLSQFASMISAISIRRLEREGGGKGRVNHI